MREVAGKIGPSLGFLSVIEHEQLGLFGGYLLLNSAARPLEFHCTAPVKPSRAQQILYGPTLEPYLYGEQIGLSLLQKARHPAMLVCTDIRGVLAARDFVETPVVLVLNRRSPEGQRTFDFGNQSLAVEGTRLDDQAHAERVLSELDRAFDLWEPFTRIHEAIQEAQRVGGRAAA